LLQLLSAQQHNDRIPAPLPMGIRVAHKTGELPGLRHDAAIIFAPSGAYVLVVMVEDAPSESDARGTIVDVSAAVYAAHEPGFQPSPDAPPPRIAEQVLRVPDGQGRLALLGDPRTETRVLPATVQTAADVPEPIRLRPELVPDLTALQQAASQAGVGFWVRAGFRQPTDAEAAYAVPTEWFLSCPIEQPPRAADRSILPADAASARAHQAWLGTAFAITDRQSGAPTFPDDTASPAWQWLLQHAAEYGFVPALPESSSSDTHEPWTLRWVGRDVARRLAPLDSADHDQRAGAELSRAEADLVAQDLSAAQPPAWGLADACWTIATTSTRGCPSRWYFLGLPLS
jgi:hypothetical protein